VAILAAIGWLAAVILAALVLRHKCAVLPVDQALTHLVLLDKSGVPESVRILKGALPAEVTRAHGKAAASRYRRVGTAALYQVKG
jgi:hypothetical protein